MAPVQHFRSALNGFNRKDVVQYIEYLTNQHKAQIDQLNTQLQTAQEKAEVAADSALQAKLNDALARCEALERQLAEQTPQCDNAELETYRRAEAAERRALDRSNQIYTQANAVLADATVQAEAAVTQMGIMADQLSRQLQDTKENFQQAMATLNAIRPEE